MGIFGSTAKAVTTRKGIAGLAILVLVIVFAVLWFNDSSLFDGAIDYLNDHGGYAVLFLAAVTAFSWISIWISKTFLPIPIALALLTTVFLIVALFIKMTIVIGA